MEIVTYLEYLSNNKRRLDWCSKEHFIKTFINDIPLYENRKDSIKVFNREHFNSLDRISDKLLYTVSFGVLLSDKEDFEEHIFEGVTKNQINQLIKDSNDNNAKILNLLIVENDFIFLSNFKEI